MKQLLLLSLLVLLANCTTLSSNTTAATIETTAQTLISSAIGYISTPECSETLTTMCSTPDVALKVNDAQLALHAALVTYRSAVKAYKLSGTDTNANTVSVAMSALNEAIAQAKKVLALESVQSVIENKE